jgi:hypothetical protein
MGRDQPGARQSEGHRHLLALPKPPGSRGPAVSATRILLIVGAVAMIVGGLMICAIAGTR